VSDISCHQLQFLGNFFTFHMFHSSLFVKENTIISPISSTEPCVT
jgi:hypothetical protein